MFTSSNKGISLFAVVIMIGVLGISLSVTRILLYQQTNAHREYETRKEMKEIYEAIMGNPEMGIFGYVGDMGRLPDNLTELVDKTSQPDYVDTVNSNGIKWGWNGPYINGGRALESYKKDAWGNDYEIVGVCQIHSNGTDGMADSADDIALPPKPLNSINGSLVLRVPKGGVLCSQSDITEIVIYYSEEGVEKSKSLGTEDFKLSDTEGFYAAAPIPLHHGIHAVKVSDSTGKTVFANIAVSAESTEAQVVGTLPYKGINLHPQFPPHISTDDNRTVEVDIVNATGCQEGEGVSYNISRIDVVELRGVEDLYLLEISFGDKDAFPVNTSISHDIKNPTPVLLMYRLQPGAVLNKLKFLGTVAPDTLFVLTYHFTDTEEPGILKNSAIIFRVK